MHLTHFLKKIVETLLAEKARFALAGGMVASLYRKEIRTTQDLDFLIQAEFHSQKLAEKILRDFRLEPHVIRQADLEGGPLFARKRKSTPVFIVVGRSQNDEPRIGLDFILPQMPWFKDALMRAQSNRIDFGFSKIPCLTVEDVIVAKLYSLKNDASRFQDLDDLKSIFLSNPQLGLTYLIAQMRRFKLTFPESLRGILPKELQVVLRSLLREC